MAAFVDVEAEGSGGGHSSFDGGDDQEVLSGSFLVGTAEAEEDARRAREELREERRLEKAQRRAAQERVRAEAQARKRLKQVVQDSPDGQNAPGDGATGLSDVSGRHAHSPAAGASSGGAGAAGGERAASEIPPGAGRTASQRISGAPTASVGRPSPGEERVPEGPFSSGGAAGVDSDRHTDSRQLPAARGLPYQTPTPTRTTMSGDSGRQQHGRQPGRLMWPSKDWLGKEVLRCSAFVRGGGRCTRQADDGESPAEPIVKMCDYCANNAVCFGYKLSEAPLQIKPQLHSKVLKYNAAFGEVKVVVCSDPACQAAAGRMFTEMQRQAHAAEAHFRRQQQLRGFSSHAVDNGITTRFRGVTETVVAASGPFPELTFRRQLPEQQLSLKVRRSFTRGDDCGHEQVASSIAIATRDFKSAAEALARAADTMAAIYAVALRLKQAQGAPPSRHAHLDRKRSHGDSPLTQAPADPPGRLGLQ